MRVPRRLVAAAAGGGIFLLFAGAVLAATPIADLKSVDTPPDTAVSIHLTGSDQSGALDWATGTAPTHGNLDSSSGTMSCVSTACSFDVLYTPDASYHGADSFTYTVTNATPESSAPATVSIAVGNPPVAGNDPGGSCSTGTSGGRYTVIEDTPLTVPATAPCGLLANDTDADSDPLTAAHKTDGSHGTDTVTSSGGFTYTPAANVGGVNDSFTYTVDDGLQQDTGTVSVSIVAVNDPPTFTDSGGEAVDEDSGAASFPNWANPISAGPNEGSQTVSVTTGTVSNPSLFSTAPAVSNSGTLSFTPAPDAFGTSTVAITAVDDGGTSNGGSNTSSIHTITITVNPVNDVPSFTGGSDPAAVNEDSGTSTTVGWASGMSVGPSNEGLQTFSFVITSNSNTALFSSAPAVSAAGTLTFTPAANRNGAATVAFAIKDSGGVLNGGVDESASQSITITVNPVDDPPNAVNDTTFTVPENAGPTALNVLANDTSLPDGPETLTIVKVTQGSHGAVAITGGGTGLTYDPAQLYLGPDQFTYTIQDSGGLLQDSATVALSVGKDITPPVETAPVQSLRTGLTMGTTIAAHVGWSATDAGVGVTGYIVQRSVDGGSYSTVTLPTATTRSISPFLTVGHSYRYRVRAIDANGNSSSYVYGPTFKDSRSEESSTAVVYGGSWLRSPFSSSYSGGYTRYAYTAGKTATFTTAARDFAFVAPVASFRGSARIYVDGVWVATISEHASTSASRRVLWATHFTTLATHSIRIVVLGNGRIDVDCFLTLH